MQGIRVPGWRQHGGRGRNVTKRCKGGGAGGRVDGVTGTKEVAAGESTRPRQEGGPVRESSRGREEKGALGC